MVSQARVDYDTTPTTLYGIRRTRAARLELATQTGDVAPLTLLSRDPVTGAVVPFSDATATDGTEFPIGFTSTYRTYTEAEVQAGIDIDYIFGGPLHVDQDKLVSVAGDIESTVIASTNKLVIDYLAGISIIAEKTTSHDTRPENL